MALKKEITDQIRDLLRQNPHGLSITAIVRQIAINRNTAGRYLETLMVSGQVEMRHFGMAKIYRLAQRVPLSAMLSISSELIMLLDNSRRVLYANEPMLRFLTTTQKDLYGRNIDYTPCATTFDDAFDLLKKKVQNGITGKEWSGELSIRNGATVFLCRIAPAVFEEGQRGVSVLLEDITGKKSAEQRLTKSERQFRLLAENSLDIITRHTPDGTCIYISPACYSIFGYKPKELIGHSAFEIMHPDDIPVIQNYQHGLTRENPVATGTHRTRHKDGHYVWVESSVRAIFDKDTGRMTEIYGVTRDITDRILAEEALRESEDRYRKLVEISPDAVLLHRDGRIVYLNPAALALIGARRSDEIIGKNVLDIVHPNFHEAVMSSIKKDLAGHITPPVELSLIRLDGTRVLVEGRGVKTFIGGQPAVQVAMRDITERKKAEEALRESEQNYRTLAEASPDFVFVIDRDDRVAYVNSHAAALFGIKADQIFKKTRSSLFSSEVARIQWEHLRKVFDSGMPLRSEGEIAVGEELRWFDHILIPITDAGGRVISVLGISRDITDRRRAEEALRESEATARALLNAPTDSVLLLDMKGVILDANETAVQRLGRSRKELIGACADAVLPGDVARMRREKIENVIETKKPIRFEDHRDGIWFDTVAYPILDSNGEVIRLAIIARDITDRKNTEEALRDTVRTFRMLAENSADIISRIRPDGTCIYVSPAVQWTLGYEPAEVTGKSGFTYLHPDDRKEVADTIRNFEENGADSGTDTFRMRHKDGSYVRFEATIRVIRDKKTGRVREFYMVSRDTGIRETH